MTRDSCDIHTPSEFDEFVLAMKVAITCCNHETVELGEFSNSPDKANIFLVVLTFFLKIQMI